MRKAKRKKRKKERPNGRTEKEERKVGKKKRERERERESKVATSGSLGVVLFTEMPLKTELWKLKTVKMCFWFP